MSDPVSRIVSDGTTYDIVDANAVHTTDTVTTSQIADGAVTEDKLGEDVTDQISALQDSVSRVSVASFSRMEILSGSNPEGYPVLRFRTGPNSYFQLACRATKLELSRTVDGSTSVIW